MLSVAVNPAASPAAGSVFVDPGPERSTPRRTAAVVVATEPSGPYRLIRLLADDLAAAVGPGQFVNAATNGACGTVLRRPLSILDVATGPAGRTVELLIHPGNTGSRWLADRREGDEVDLLGPLGRRFPLPAAASRALVVGGGLGTVALALLTRALTGAGHDVTCLVGGASRDRLVAVDRLRAAGSVQIATDDGSAGVPGTVLQLLEPALAAGGVDVVYACGPMPMLAAAVAAATRAGVPSWVSVETAMACGYGVCLTCALPVRDAAGIPRMTRVCTEGPVLPGAAVCWDAHDRIPEACGA